VQQEQGAYSAARAALTRRPPSGERRGDPPLDLVLWDGQVEVDPVALRAQGVQLLEPDGGPLTSGIDDDHLVALGK